MILSKRQTLKLAFKIFVMLFNSLIYSGSSVVLLYFINNHLLKINEKNLTPLLLFMLYLLLFLAFSIFSRIALSNIGNEFVFELRTKIIKRILDTPNQKINSIGKSNLLASLSSDILALTNGFMRIPELIQGGLTIIFASCYIAYLSPVMFGFLCLWMGFSLAVSMKSMKKINEFFQEHRKNEDTLYKDYQTTIEGHRELSLNNELARHLYENRFIPNAILLRKNIIKAEIHQALSSNWISAMMLGGIGIVLYFCLAYNMASLQDAITIALAILFLRAPLMMVLFSLPSIFRSKIAYERLKKLDLEPFKSNFEMSETYNSWKRLELRNINFDYDSGFGLKDINLALNRSEITFLIGKNGSGKSTLFNVLSGILEPKGGEILIDNEAISKQNIKEYRNSIAAIFSDLYVFDEILNYDLELANALFEKFGLSKKVEIKDGKFSTTNLSNGQKRRLLLISALLSGRKFLMLDEFAADLDPEFRREFYREILPDLKAKGYTIFAISHDDAYFDVADKIYKIENGKLSTA